MSDSKKIWLACDIADEVIKWYVPNLLPETGLVLIVGPAGAGKTNMATSILAALSLGLRPLTQIAEVTAPRRALILSREESRTAIKNRLIQMRANLDYVRVGIQTHDHLRDVPRSLNEDIAENHTAIILIDSLTAFTAGNLNSRREMFGALNSLRIVAEPNPEKKYSGALILLIHHMNSRSGSISDRTAGSKAILGVVRHALHVGVHPFDDSRRVLSVCKSNIGPENENRTFTLSPFVWGDRLDATTAELLGGTEDTPNRAASWLLSRMEPGVPVAASDLFKQAGDSRGLSRRSLQRAARYLEIDTDRIGFGGNVFWTLAPNEADVTKPIQGKLLFEMPKGPESIQ